MLNAFFLIHLNLLPLAHAVPTSRTGMIRLALFVSILLGAGACRRAEEPPQPPPAVHLDPPAPPLRPSPLPAGETEPPIASRQESWPAPDWKERVRALEEHEAADRREFVRAAPPRWKPLTSGRKLRLSLIPQKTLLQKGESLWYRLELQNVGSEAIWFFEPNSFFKRGAWASHKWQVFVDGQEIQLGDLDFGAPAAMEPFPPPGWERLTDEQKAAEVERLNRESEAARRLRENLNVTLKPGETLVSRPWRHLGRGEAAAMRERGEDPDRARAPGEFRELYSVFFRFDRPGTHLVQVFFRDPPPEPPTESDFQFMHKRGYGREVLLREHRERVSKALGTIESNVVEVRVAP